VRVQETSTREIVIPDEREVRVLGGAGAAAGNWWDPNNEGLCVVGAYQAKGAGSYANSKVNQANPGTYDLTELLGAVAWVDGIGWQFTAINDNVFDTGWTPQNDQSQSVLCRFADRANTGRLLGTTQGGPAFDGFAIQPFIVRYDNGAGAGKLQVAPALDTGNLGIAGSTAYRNGVAEVGAIGAWAAPSTVTVFIGGLNNVGLGTAIAEFSGDIMAVVQYDCVLTAPQMLAVAAAMAAL